MHDIKVKRLPAVLVKDAFSGKIGIMLPVVPAPRGDPFVIPRVPDSVFKPVEICVYAGFVPGLFHGCAEGLAHCVDCLVRREAVRLLVPVRVLHVEPHAEPGLPAIEEAQTPLRLQFGRLHIQRIAVPVDAPRDTERVAFGNVALRPFVGISDAVAAADDDKAILVRREIEIALILGNVYTVHFHVPPYGLALTRASFAVPLTFSRTRVTCFAEPFTFKYSTSPSSAGAVSLTVPLLWLEEVSAAP